MEARRLGLVVLGAAVVAASLPVMAEDADDARQEVSRLWNVESMMWQAAENISRRYNLNTTQRAETHKLLTEEVGRFLDEHDDIWPLIRDLARHQMSGKDPEGDVGRRIGERALPLLREMQDAILEGNSRWREILTDEQREMHDWDLRDIDRTFSKMEANFSAMSQGARVKPRVFPSRNTEEPQPKQPSVPPTNFGPRVPEPVGRVLQQEDAWDKFVQEFIRRFELDDAQSDAALSVLRECKDRAHAYRQSREKDFAQAAQRLRQAHNSDQPAEVRKAKISVWTQIQKGLTEPVAQLRVELEERLNRIPTEAQKERERRRSGRPATPPGKVAGEARKVVGQKSPAPSDSTPVKTPAKVDKAKTKSSKSPRPAGKVDEPDK